MLSPVRAVVIASLSFSSTVAAQTSSLHIRIDQFGYRISAQKLAVLREPVVGFDAPAVYTPGAKCEVRKKPGGAVAFTGPVTKWRNGATHKQSGDRVWWFDFTALRAAGTYYVYDPTNKIASEPFVIGTGPDVYGKPLEQALRAFYYQRCGTPKTVASAGAAWADAGPCHVGTSQDRDCRLVTNPTATSARDLSGGWHDAGDYNKYVNFADQAVHNLLHAYEEHPNSWGDALGIPESGNKAPDILDEVAYELRWLLKMQSGDGSVLHKVSVTSFRSASPPSKDANIRRYAPATASATISACGAFAHAAIVYKTVPGASWAAFAKQLEQSSEKAWSWLAANPNSIPSKYDNKGFVNATAEDSAADQASNRLCAAVYLFALTGKSSYRAFVDANYAKERLFIWSWAEPYVLQFQDALLYYARTANATATVADRIHAKYASVLLGAKHLGKFKAGDDPYRAFFFAANTGWGSNRLKAGRGVMLAALNRQGLASSEAAVIIAAAEGYLHYLHGVNPMGFAYLTNMGKFGAEKSLCEMYHGWFGDGTVWDNCKTSLHGPPPGFVTGGPNPGYRPGKSYTGPLIAPPMNQPTLKSYKDWNTGWPQNSWQVTEPQIPYQAIYVRLAAEFALPTVPALGLSITSLAANRTASFHIGGASTGQLVAILWAPSRGQLKYTVAGWCIDLGLQLSGDPTFNILGVGKADAKGELTVLFPIPPGTTGTRIYLQGAQAGSCPEIRHSAVIPAEIR